MFKKKMYSHGVVGVHQLHCVVADSGRVQVKGAPHIACVEQQLVRLPHT